MTIAAKKNWLFVGLLLVVGGAVWVFSGPQLEDNGILPGSPTAIEFVVDLDERYSEFDSIRNGRIVVTDPAKVGRVMRVLQSGKENRDHKCGNVASMELDFGKDQITLGLLPGHQEDRYEFRYDGENYSVDRKAFIDALVYAGISTDRIPLATH